MLPGTMCVSDLRLGHPDLHGLPASRAWLSEKAMMIFDKPLVWASPTGSTWLVSIICKYSTSIGRLDNNQYHRQEVQVDQVARLNCRLVVWL